jgi:hypothetical protein
LAHARANIGGYPEGIDWGGKMKILATVKPSEDGKLYELIIAERVIGTSKIHCDAQYIAGVINIAFDYAIADAENAAHSEGYDMGYQAAINFVAAGE